MHVPPFRHGMAAHDPWPPTGVVVPVLPPVEVPPWACVVQVSPAHPAAHWQLFVGTPIVVKEVQVPPFAQ